MTLRDDADYLQNVIQQWHDEKTYADLSLGAPDADLQGVGDLLATKAAGFLTSARALIDDYERLIREIQQATTQVRQLTSQLHQERQQVAAKIKPGPQR